MFTCKDCPDRFLGCHDHCEKYQQEKAEHEDRRRREKATRDAVRNHYEVMDKIMDSQAKKKKKHKGYFR